MRFGGRLAISARVSLCQRVGEAYYGFNKCLWFSAKCCGTGSWWHGNGCARVFVAAASDGRMRIRGVTDTIIITISRAGEGQGCWA